MNELVLGIESSCDECAAAVVSGGRTVEASIVHSQIDEHVAYRGVVPEIASRSHLRTMARVVDAALSEAGVDLGELDAIAVTARPGLIGSLLVGVSTAKGLCLGTGLPLVAVHHIEAHVYSAMLDAELPEFPCLALVVSGGHTALYHVTSPIEMTKVASTTDDAAGECFDKVASILGLAYPGGPAIAELAMQGDPTAVRLPRFQPRDGALGFSFSGLKTAVLYHVRGQDARTPTPEAQHRASRADVAASAQDAIVDVLIAQTLAAAQRFASNRVLVTGGVACNARLRQRMHAAASERDIRTTFPPPRYCTDNAAMVAGIGWHLLRAGRCADLAFDASPR